MFLPDIKSIVFGLAVGFQFTVQSLHLSSWNEFKFLFLVFLFHIGNPKILNIISALKVLLFFSVSSLIIGGANWYACVSEFGACVILFICFFYFHVQNCRYFLFDIFKTKTDVIFDYCYLLWSERQGDGARLDDLLPPNRFCDDVEHTCNVSIFWFA